VVPEPDCIARFGELVIVVFNIKSARPVVEYNLADVPPEIKTAVDAWINHQKFAGLPLVDYLLALFKVSDFYQC
jgi:hypothetical protein